MANVRLEFGWKYKCYELRACPKHLARLSPDEPNETIDLVKWTEDGDGRSFCYSLAYFVRYSEGYYLRFVGDRPFQNIEKEDVPIVWSALHAAQTILDTFWALQDEDGEC